MINIKKKLFLILTLFSLCFSGCSKEIEQIEQQVTENTTVFTISREKQSYLSEISEKYLDDYSWQYSDENIIFSSKTFEKGEHFDKIVEASAEIELDFSSYHDKKLIEVKTDLQYFNSETAGTAYFYFDEKELVGAYYSALYDENSVYSFKDRNAFLEDVTFAKYEDLTIEEEFSDVIENTTLPAGFTAIGKDSSNTTVAAVIDGYKVNFYKYGKNGFTYSRGLTFENTGLFPSDIMLFNQDNRLQFAIMLSQSITDELHEEPTLQSEKIIFYNEYFAKSYEDLILESKNYRTMGFAEENFILFQGHNMEIYTRENNVWKKSSKISLEGEVEEFCQSDIDSDGKIEYIMSDGKDLYIYHKDGKIMKNIWKTHISVESLMGDIFAADLNNDGVKEIYLHDITGTAIKYVLTPKGFISKGNYEYGEQIYPWDFNGDKRDDYMKIQAENEENVSTIFIGK